MTMETKRAFHLDRRKLYVDTNGKCFLCLQNSENLEDAVGIKEEFEGTRPTYGNLVSILSIARYLKIYPGQLVSSGSETCHQSNISNLLVTLCEICCPLATRLSSLCLELEVLQMKLEHQLKSFYGTLGSTERDPDLSHYFRKSTSADHFLLAGTMRQRMTIACRRKLRRPLAAEVVVSTSAFTDISIISAQNAPCQESASGDNILSEPGNPPPRWNIPVDRTFGLTCKLCNAHFQYKSLWVRHVNSECPHIDPGIASLNPEDSYNCHLCQVKVRVSEARRHKIQHHADTLLSSHKLSHLTSAEFKEYCDHVFQVELHSCRRKPGPAGGATLKCPNCEKGYSSHYNVYYHLFTEHRELMGMKLVELQENTGLEVIRRSKLPSSSMDHRGISGKVSSKKPWASEKDMMTNAIWVEDDANSKMPYKFRLVKCTLCNPHKQMKLRFLKDHQIRYHLESFFQSFQTTNVSMSDFKLYCEHAFKQQMLSSVKVYDDKGKPSWKCRLCPRDISSEITLNRHFILEHKEYMGERIQDLQENVPVSELGPLTETGSDGKDDEYIKWNCLKCGAGFQLESTLKRHMRHTCEFGSKIPRRVYKCEVCGRECPSPSDLKRHNSKVHLKILKRRRKPVESEEGLNIVQAQVTKMEQANPRVLTNDKDRVLRNGAQDEDAGDNNEMIVPDDNHMVH